MGKRRFASRHLPALVLCMLMSAAVVALLALRAAGSSDAGPDLTVEISVVPAIPGVNEATTINLLVRNIGTSAVAGPANLRVYIDPPQPPDLNTAAGAIFTVPPLGAGEQSIQTIPGYVFGSEGCGHAVYGWVNRDGSVAETNPNNNRVALTVCVGNVSCQPDSYEAGTGDNTRTAARWFLENVTQARSLCNAQNAAAADSDWVKFTVFSGVTYTLATSNPQAHTDAVIALDGSCGLAGNGQAGPVTWQSQVNGICYAGIQQDGPIVGPLTAYSLTLTSATGAVDGYEPDNSCAVARDIVTDGTRQSHLFAVAGDQDWVKFSVAAGASFLIAADNVTPGTAPLVTVFGGCDQVEAGNSLAGGGAQVQRSSATAAVYYARVTNQDPNSFGADRRYDLRVTVTACTADGSEADNSAGAARRGAVGQGVVHNVCPAGDEDWVKLTLEQGKTYVLQTTDLAFAADTVLTLYAADGATKLAENDDYGYVSGSRLTYVAPATADYYARVKHVNAAANGPNTQYTLVAQEGFCRPDTQEGAAGNNGPGDAVQIAANGGLQANNFCADALNAGLGDQDWTKFNTVAGGRYDVSTSGLGPNSDPVLELYGSDGKTLILANDDAGAGLGAALVYTATSSGPRYVRVRQYNSNLTGDDTQYQIQLQANEPPTPTPAPTPIVVPTATPSPTPAAPATVLTTTKTLILINAELMAQTYGTEATGSMLDKLSLLADDPAVAGALVPVESDPAVAAALAAWRASPAALADVAPANAVAAAVRNRVMALRANAPNLQYIVVVGDDRMIPFRRVFDLVGQGGAATASIEQNYAANVAADGTVRAALAANMILTDDYLGDTGPATWKDRQDNEHELYIADLAVGRLVETPAEIGAFIDSYLAGDGRIDAKTGKALVTGYDFVQDSAGTIASLFQSDQVATDSTLVAAQWGGAALQAKYLAANPRFDVFSANGHATHVGMGAPDNADLTAAAVVGASANLAGALVFSVGCHGGLNDPGILDLPEAFLSRGANYVGNTGFGWGGSGVVYSEALMRTYSRELLREGSIGIGPALVAAKQKYYAQARTFTAYDAKILMQVTLYGLPMVQLITGGTLSDADPFPSADTSFTPPTAFGPLAQGSTGYQLPGSFGAFGQESSQLGRASALTTTSCLRRVRRRSRSITPTPGRRQPANCVGLSCCTACTPTPPWRTLSSPSRRTSM